MPNPDKPHAFRVRTITNTRMFFSGQHTPHSRDQKCPQGLRHRVGNDATGDRTCNVCGGSETLLIHDVEAARFRHKYGLDIGLTWSEVGLFPYMSAKERRKRKEYTERYRQGFSPWPGRRDSAA